MVRATDATLRVGTVTHQVDIDDILSGRLARERDYRCSECGGGYYPVHDCPECGRSAYLSVEDEEGCVLCEFVLEGDCARCSETLTPENVAWDSNHLCSYCDHVMAKD